ncbi:MAG: deoxyribodipyrimidine photo-lyase [Sedimentisphaerales bacterium]|nr:deoxyribodipyrimidine photo-lyase [Sedimentisphaerales bacterium]
MNHEERIQPLNHQPLKDGSYVIYWMQAAQRSEYNHALEFAVRKANQLKKPLLVFFGIREHYPNANERHFYFMLEGLREVRQSLEQRGIRMIILRESPQTGILAPARDASLVVADKGYLSFQRKWRQSVAKNIKCSMLEIDTNVVVPVNQASPKEEYAAATIRKKINRQLENYLRPLHKTPLRSDSLGFKYRSFDIDDIDKTIKQLDIDRSVKPVTCFTGGTSQAKKLLKIFIQTKLSDYEQARNNPVANGLSQMSPYLHFGQISPLYIAIKVLKHNAHLASAYLEELIVRRELAINYVWYNPRYDCFEGLPPWAQTTLRFHQKDKRTYLYTRDEFEQALTHDPYWNAAQKEMMLTGKMHGYLRMYWGKKILEWSRSPKTAFQTALYLNDKYELDGRDPNGYTGVAWCLGKHDRPWARRKIFGTVRYMNDKGLQRKFDADAYVRKIDHLTSD